MNKTLLGTALSLSMLGFTSSASALVVNVTNDANPLSNAILGSGIPIHSPTYSGASGASGTFTDGLSSGIGMESGIILTTGSATDAVGPNLFSDTTTENGMSGLPELDALIPGYTSYDATKLSIDFTSNGDSVYFNYVFASEEYNEWVGSEFNDVFGLFLDGVNLAVVPGSGNNVAINTVNNTSNSIYYNDNEFGSFNIEYDGFTTILTASFSGLSAGMHTLDLAIADAGDSALDSAVFIQGGTLSDTPTPVPAPTTLALLGLGMAAIRWSRKKAA